MIFLYNLFLLLLFLQMISLPFQSIIFLPFFSFPIGAGLGAMVAVDLLGAIRGWRMFDHYCHLGGAAFGFLYFSYGKQWWEEWKSIGRRLKDESSSNS